MKILTLFLLIVVVATAAFAALNWSAVVMPATLSLGVTFVQAPLGLVMLGLLAFLTSLLLVFMAYSKTSVFFKERRYAREMQTTRELAEQAEASRFTELREFLDVELKKQAGLEAESTAVLLARLDRLERDLRSAVEQSGKMPAAYSSINPNQKTGRTNMGMKEAYERKLQAQLDEWTAEIDKLKAKADKAEADTQLEYYKQIEELRVKQETAKEKLGELKEAGENAWEDLKAGINSAWDSLGNALKTAADRFN